jgi:hypothetical protein
LNTQPKNPVFPVYAGLTVRRKIRGNRREIKRLGKPHRAGSLGQDMADHDAKLFAWYPPAYPPRARTCPLERRERTEAESEKGPQIAIGPGLPI